MDNPYSAAAAGLRELVSTPGQDDGRQRFTAVEGSKLLAAIGRLDDAAHDHQKRALLKELEEEEHQRLIDSIKNDSRLHVIQEMKVTFPFWEEIDRRAIHEKLGHIATQEQPLYQIDVDLPGAVNAYVLKLARAGANNIMSTPDGHLYRISYWANTPIRYQDPKPQQPAAPADEWTTLRKSCIFCHKEHTIHVKTDDLMRYHTPNTHPPYVQDVFPYLSATEREMFISGCCDECWPAAPDENDGPDETNPDDLTQENDDPNAPQNELAQLGREDLAREMS